MMRAFRHIPVLAGVARDLAEVAPQAWVFNYTNPLSANVIAMRRAAPVRTVGLCTCSVAPRHPVYLAMSAAIEPEELAVPAPAAGLNHCAAIVDLRLRDGRDAMPLVYERVTQPVTRWALDGYGLLIYCWSHWTEFYPSLRRLEEPYKGRLQGLKMSHGITVHDMELERDRARRWEALAGRLAQGEEELSLDVLPQDESVQVVEVMEALLTNAQEIHVVNVPNGGAIPNLPRDAIVEVSSVVGTYGIRPLQMPPLPEPVAATLRQHITVQELTVEAALSGDRHIALQAFLQDPNVAGVLTPEETGKLLDELLEAHARDLPAFA
jgi:alpha-galactosidase